MIIQVLALLATLLAWHQRGPATAFYMAIASAAVLWLVHNVRKHILRMQKKRLENGTYVEYVEYVNN